MSHRIKLLTIILTICCLASYAQQPATISNLRKKNIAIKNSSISVDSLSIVPGSFFIPGFSKESFLLNEIDAQLNWVVKPSIDSVWVMYRVLPYKINAPVKGLNYDSIRYNFLAEPVSLKTNSGKSTGILDFGGLESEGSIGRAISFGNSQDAVVNSSMNLQLHGFIGDSLELNAAITDNNIPIQPDGNTRDLRDFDRIYLQVKKDGWQIGFGDIDLRFTKDYFLSFYKRLQGANFSSLNKWGNSQSNYVQVSGAIAKGKFTRNTITPLEGNQGPYRLNGANNELYFVVLAGTEKVFIDGELLQRGEDQDYVINYNTAEITFTPKRLIQKDRRIQAEFEYADRNFLNSQLFLNDEYAFNKNLSINIAAYSNTDAKNSTIDQSLDQQQKQFLASLGDTISNAYYSNATLEKYEPGKLLYKRIDTLYNANRHDSIYILSADTTASLYNVTFTYLGPGKGSYIPILNATNGRAFQWISPDINSAKRGEWEPISLLATPKQQQIVTAGVNYKISEKTLISCEGAFSKMDVNLFSAKEKFNDNGFAVKANMQHSFGKIRLGKENWEIIAAGSMEKVSRNFRPVERLRNVEFLRDWSLPFDAGFAKENLTSGSLIVKTAKGSRLKYDGISYTRDNDYSGFRNTIDQYIDAGKWKLTGRISMLHFSTGSQSGSFFRPFAEMRKEFTKLNKAEVSFKLTAENNTIHPKGLDSITASSFAFHIYEFNVRSNQTQMNKWNFSYFRREDFLPAKNILLKADKSDNFGFGSDLLKNPNHQLRLSINYRRLTIENAAISKRKAEETILGRSEYNLNLKNGFLAGNFFYELGSGQELNREFAYVAVQAGQGEYTWIDYNNNGIEELNEFEVAVFQDQKKYIRVYTPGRTYVKANYLQFNYSVDINPRSIIKDGKGVKKILYRSNISSALQINRKQLSAGQFMVNPFGLDLADSNLITLSTFFSNTYFYNRTDPKWGIEATHSRSSGKSLLVYGFESRVLENINTRLRLRLNKSWVSNLNYRFSENMLSNSNPSFRNRNYSIDQHSVEPSFTYIYKSNFRLMFAYSYTRKSNTIDSMERAINNDLSTELQYNILSGSRLKARFSFNNIRWQGYAGSQQTTVGFLLLNGLLPGKNYLWSLDFTKRIGGNLEMNIQYEGRKPSGTNMVHIGRAGIRAIF